jgi:hypothetical protein
VWAGSLDGQQGLPPPPDSFAAQAASEVAIFFIQLAPGGRYTIPAAAGGSAVNRMLYFTEGEDLSINSESVKRQNGTVTLKAGEAAELHNPHATVHTELLILQGVY